MHVHRKGKKKICWFAFLHLIQEVPNSAKKNINIKFYNFTSNLALRFETSSILFYFGLFQLVSPSYVMFRLSEIFTHQRLKKIIPTSNCLFANKPWLCTYKSFTLHKRSVKWSHLMRLLTRTHISSNKWLYIVNRYVSMCVTVTLTESQWDMHVIFCVTDEGIHGLTPNAQVLSSVCLICLRLPLCVTSSLSHSISNFAFFIDENTLGVKCLKAAFVVDTSFTSLVKTTLRADRTGRWAERNNAKRQNGWQIDGEVHSVSQTDKMLEKQAIKLREKGGTAWR